MVTPPICEYVILLAYVPTYVHVRGYTSVRGQGRHVSVTQIEVLSGFAEAEFVVLASSEVGKIYSSIGSTVYQLAGDVAIGRGRW